MGPTNPAASEEFVFPLKILVPFIELEPSCLKNLPFLWLIKFNDFLKSLNN